MADVYAIFFEVDKCTRCFACTVACNRQNNLIADHGADTVQADDYVVVKAQTKVDMAPFVRYSCWQCPSPPCVGQCPLNHQSNDKSKPLKSDKTTWAIVRKPNGAVVVNHGKCNPSLCDEECRRLCQRGGYPKIGIGSTSVGRKANKCDMCWTHLDIAYGGNNSDANTKLDKPACVKTCPNGALHFGKKSAIIDNPSSGDFNIGSGYHHGTGNDYVIGDGSTFWLSHNGVFRMPKADPFVEDHISPMVTQLFTSPAGKALVVPALIAGGLYALYKRKVELVGDES